MVAWSKGILRETPGVEFVATIGCFKVCLWGNIFVTTIGFFYLEIWHLFLNFKDMTESKDEMGQLITNDGDALGKRLEKVTSIDVEVISHLPTFKSKLFVFPAILWPCPCCGRPSILRLADTNRPCSTESDRKCF